MTRLNITKRINQEKQMRKRYSNITQLNQQKYHLLERLGQARRDIQQHRTDEVHRDNVSADIRNPQFLRYSSRIRNIQSQIDCIDQRITRIRSMNHE